MKNKAFTLAEVLITLGIVGVVCALTIPQLIAKYQQEKTVVQLKKFYNEINNAVRMSVVDNGDVNLWSDTIGDYSYEENVQFLHTYIFPYLKIDKFEKCKKSLNGRAVCTLLLDGRKFLYGRDQNGTDIALYINGKEERTPRNYFSFQLNKTNYDIDIPTTFVEPYQFQWDGDIETLQTHSIRGCRDDISSIGQYNFCTKWIQLNNWKIPDGYPWNGKYNYNISET